MLKNWRCATAAETKEDAGCSGMTGWESIVLACSMQYFRTLERGMESQKQRSLP